MNSAEARYTGTSVADVNSNNFMKCRIRRKNRTRSQDEGSSDDSDRAIERDDERSTRIRRKKRRCGAQQFILDDVEVDDEDEDASSCEEGEEVGIDPSEREEAERLMRQQEEISCKRRSRDFFSEMSEEQIEEYFKQKYGKQTDDLRMTLEESDSSGISYHALLPSVKDPRIWVVKCRIGEEKSAVLKLLRKTLALQDTNNPVQIKSCFVKEGFKGFVYIEAFKKSHVLTAIDDISGLNRYGLKMVPIEEMPDCLKVIKRSSGLKSGTYVRMLRTKYKDDLAQVDLVDVLQKRVYLKLVPRIDYLKKRGALKDKDDGPLVRKMRPQPQLFNVERIRELGGEVTTDGDFYSFEGDHYREGFLYKWFPLDAIKFDNVEPKLEEVEMLIETKADLKNKLDSVKIPALLAKFVPGDAVVVTEGELMNLRGRVKSCDGKKVLIAPDHEDLKDPLTFDVGELKKFFKVGDHVKVTHGKYKDETGFIVRVEKNAIVFVSDSTLDEIKVLPRFAEISSNIASGVAAGGNFRHLDLVLLDQHTVGCIIRTAKDYVDVLSMHGKVLQLKPQAIRGRKDSRFAQALDKENNSLHVKDMVKIVEGSYALADDEEFQQGEIVHLYRSYAFVQLRNRLENGGIIVCKPRHLRLVGGKDTPAWPLSNRVISAPDRTPESNYRSSPASTRSIMQRNSPQIYGLSSHDIWSTQKVRRDNQLIGKNVRIIQGPLKGYFGIVKDSTDLTARVELHTNCKTVSVDRSRLQIVGMSSDSQTLGSADYGTPVSDSGRTPMYGGDGKTPMYSDRSPNNRTPSSSHTPEYTDSTAWDFRISNPPAYNSFTTPIHSATNDLTAEDRIFGELDLKLETPPIYFNTDDHKASYYSKNERLENSLLSGDWIGVDMIVQFKENCPNASLRGLEGTVRSVFKEEKRCNVYLFDLDQETDVSYNQVSPVEPMEGDRVKVIHGTEVGRIGILVSKDDGEAIIDDECGSSISIPVISLCRMENV